MLFKVNLSLRLVVPPGFEPGSWDPEPHMMDRYTKGLASRRDGVAISTEPLDPIVAAMRDEVAEG